MIAGIDEAGRGCIAGAVIAAVVILHPERPLAGLADSKQLSPTRRKVLAERIKTDAAAWAIGRAEASEIDRINILQASLLAMQRAYAGLDLQPELVLVDGNRLPTLPCPAQAVVRGDSLVAAISAASILAKVSRDEEMQVLDALYPGYDFAVHKGYPTAAHLQRLQQLGVSPLHRKTFGPVRRLLA